MSWYVDSSVIIASILDEQEKFDLATIFQSTPVTSRLTRVEVLRKISKTDPAYKARAMQLLNQIHTVDMSEVILTRAESYTGEITVKAADAIHLATAETLSKLIDGVVTLDKQMASNARKLELTVY